MNLGLRASGALVAMSFASSVASGCAGDTPRGRRITTESWDTVAIWGGASAEDTTFHQPVRLILWEDRVAVVDGITPHLRVFDKKGQRLWSFGRTGKGPGEFDQISMLDVAANGNLLVFDPNLRKVVEMSAEGALVNEVLLEPAARGTALLRLRDRIVLTANQSSTGVIEVEQSTYRHIRSRPLPMRDSVPLRAVLMRMNARVDNAGEDWVSAFYMGPGFFVYSADSATYYPYIEHVPFMVVSAGFQDSLRFGAHSVDVIDDEIYMLFGGRPGQRDIQQERPRFIDVYDLNGRYQRSLRMPLDAFTLTTDGELFYALQWEPVPALVILQPK